MLDVSGIIVSGLQYGLQQGCIVYQKTPALSAAPTISCCLRMHAHIPASPILLPRSAASSVGILLEMGLEGHRRLNVRAVERGAIA